MTSIPACSHPNSCARLVRSYCRVVLPIFSRTCEPRRLTHIDHGLSAEMIRTDFEGMLLDRHGKPSLVQIGSGDALRPYSMRVALRGQRRGFVDQKRGGPKCGSTCPAPDRKRRVGPCSNLLDVPKPDLQRALSYLMLSSRFLVLALLPGPLCDLPQSLNREQWRFGHAEIRIWCSGVVGQAGGDSPVVAVRHTNDEVRIWPSAHPDELDALAMQRMMGMGHSHPFLRSLGKGGSGL